jgi:hypothetical protein
VKTHLEVVCVLLQVYLFIIVYIFSAAAVMKLCIKKKNERPFVELGDDGETAQWKWQKSMQPHFVALLCVYTLRNPEFSAQIS